MKIKVWAVISCIPERGEPPVWPAIFGTEAEAEAHADQELRNEWEAVGEWDEDRNVLADYPGNWRDANDRLKAKFSDGSWGEYQIITQEIEIGRETFDEVFNAAVESAIERRMNEDLGAILVEHEDKLKRRLIDPMVAALKNASATIGWMDQQISQMEGMFPDDDGQIAEAREDGDVACAQIEAVLAHYETGAPLPVPEIYITMDGGLIQDVNSTGSLVGASYTIIDYDVEGAEDVRFIECADGVVTEACIGGGNIGEFTSKIVDDEDPIQAKLNEDECCEALVEAGWRREIAAGSMLFRHDATGRQINESTWYGLSKVLLAEV